MSKFSFNQKAYHFLVFMTIGLSPTLSFVNYITNMIGMDTSVDTLLVFAVAVGIMFLFVLKNIRLLAPYFLWIILGVLLLIFSMALHSTLFYLENVTNDIIYNSIYFIIGVSLCLNESTMRTINNASKYTVIVCFVIILTDVARGNIISDHDMVSSYIVLTPTVFLISDFLQYKRITDLIFSGLGIFCIILYGTRGPLLALAVSFTILILLFGKSNKKLLYIIISLAIALFYREILILARDVLTQLNLGSMRIIDMLIAGDISNDNGRKALQDLSIEYLKESPLIGMGLYGNMAKWGFYPHNIFLELPVQFGVPISIVIVFFSITFAIKRYKYLFLNEKFFVVTLLSSILAKLMVTGSYLNESLLFLLFGFILNYGRGIVMFKDKQPDY